MKCIAGLACDWKVSSAYISAQHELLADTRVPFFAFILILNVIKICTNKILHKDLYDMLIDIFF